MADIFSIGRSGLQASKKSLEVTGHNIANVGTKGFSRQKVLQKTNQPLGGEGLVQGTGVTIKSIVRVHSPQIEKNLLQQISNHQYDKTRWDEMIRIEDIFNEVDNEGLNHILNKFYNAFRELSTQPENETMRSIVRDKASFVAKGFHHIQETLLNLSKKIDDKMTAQIETINSTSKTIAGLNKQIASLESVGRETGDLRDQRDLAIRKLAEFFYVHSYKSPNGQMNVSAKGVGTLVSGGHVQELMARSVHQKKSSDNREGGVEIFFKDRPGQKITSRFKGGGMSSAIHIRNKDIKDLRERIDEIAFEFAWAVNKIHKRGYSQASSFSVTGIPFFKVSKSREGAGLSLDLSDFVKASLGNIATGLSPHSPRDNRVAIMISNLQYEKTMASQTATTEEHFLKTIGRVGLETGKAKTEAEHSEALLAQGKSFREEISGVSLDEETSNLLRFQNAYEASAKVMKTADEMFKSVLNL